jgi:hypothetical protein
MKFSETYRHADARRSHRKPFHLDKHRTLDSATSWGGHRVELIKARRADKYGHDPCYEVRCVMWWQGPKWREPLRRALTTTQQGIP